MLLVGALAVLWYVALTRVVDSFVRDPGSSVIVVVLAVVFGVVGVKVSEG
jgi:hypothetical protein